MHSDEPRRARIRFAGSHNNYNFYLQAAAEHVSCKSKIEFCIPLAAPPRSVIFRTDLLAGRLGFISICIYMTSGCMETTQ